MGTEPKAEVPSYKYEWHMPPELKLVFGFLATVVILFPILCSICYHAFRNKYHLDEEIDQIELETDGSFRLRRNMSRRATALHSSNRRAHSRRVSELTDSISKENDGDMPTPPESPSTRHLLRLPSLSEHTSYPAQHQIQQEQIAESCSGKCGSASVASIPVSKCSEANSPPRKCHAPSISRQQSIDSVEFVTCKEHPYQCVGSHPGSRGSQPGSRILSPSSSSFSTDTLSAMPPTHRHHNRRFNPGQSSNPCNNGLTDCNQSVVDESPISLARGSCKDNYHQMKSSGGGCGQGSDFRGQGGDFRGQPPPFVPPPHPYTKETKLKVEDLETLLLFNRYSSSETSSDYGSHKELNLKASKLQMSQSRRSCPKHKNLQSNRTTYSEDE